MSIPFNLADPSNLLPLTSLGGLFNNPDDVWDLLEASFLNEGTQKANPGAKPVLFHVFKSQSPYQGAVPEVRDRRGRRKVFYQFPFVDGQTSGDLGRKPIMYEFDCLIFGAEYKTGLNSLIGELDQPNPGTLVHPVLGSVRVVPVDYELVHEYSKKNAVHIKLSFAEHNYDVGQLTTQNTIGKKSSKSALKTLLQAALSAVRAVDTVINQVQAVAFGIQSIRNEINQRLTNYKAAFTSLLQQLNTTFNGGSSLDIPALLPTNEGGTGTTSGGQTQASFPLVASANDPFQNIVTQTIASQAILAALTAQQALQVANSLRDQVAAIIQLLEGLGNGQGSLIYYAQILALRQGVIQMQQAVEGALQSSNSLIGLYTTPRLMTVREVAFAIGLTPDDSDQLIILNPTLLSYNYIAEGTVLTVPVAAA